MRFNLLWLEFRYAYIELPIIIIEWNGKREYQRNPRVTSNKFGEFYNSLSEQTLSTHARKRNIRVIQQDDDKTG